MPWLAQTLSSSLPVLLGIWPEHLSPSAVAMNLYTELLTGEELAAGFIWLFLFISY